LNVLITILTVLLVIDCLLLIGIILLQRGKGQGLAGAFGVGSMEEALGTRAASTAQKITTVLAVVFLTLSIAIGLLRRAVYRPDAASASADGRPAPSAPMEPIEEPE
jgi:preprotein translocase subunit SecG